MISLLATHGIASISLSSFFQTAFLDLSPEHLRQMMDFLSKSDHIWIMKRILMEIPFLDVEFSRNEDADILISEGFSFCSFNMKRMLSQFNTFFMEAIVLHQSACQERHEEELREAQERRRVERFIKSLWTLWKTNDINVFFQELIVVCPEFNSYCTNWCLLEVVVDEFRLSIYNATIRSYHNREICEDHLLHFLEYATIRGVFSPKVPLRENIRICKYSSDSCPFGSTCSGVHQCFVSSGWKTGSVWGTCCQEYAERRTCRNPHCRYAHMTGDEFNRAFRNGGKDSKRTRNDLLAEAYIAKRQKDD